MTVRVLQGDCLSVLRSLPAESVQTCVTSPPYFNLRSYLPSDHPDKALEIGSERTIGEYIARLVEVFDAVRRVLRRDGTCWVNIGDSYAGSWGAQGARETPAKGPWRNSISNHPKGNRTGSRDRYAGAKPKDLLLVPHRLAIALQDAGWWVRSDVIWHKPSGMPESVEDRPTTTHEHLLLLAKEARYFYDRHAISEPADVGARGAAFAGQHAQVTKRRQGRSRKPDGLTRNARTVWSISAEPSSDSHFALMPSRLAERCILAGTSERGACPHCGAAWRRLVKRTQVSIGNAALCGTTIVGKGFVTSEVRENHDIRDGPATMVETIGWEPCCACPKHIPVPCVVLDPFAGAGTTGLTADRLGRDATLVELHQDYVALAQRRIEREGPLTIRVDLPVADAVIPAVMDDLLACMESQ